jgi:hypothetical protein
LILGDTAGPEFQAGNSAVLRRRASRTQVVQGVHEAAGVGIGTTQRLDVQHFAPHVTGAGLAEVQFDLNRGFQGLYVMEDQRERQQTSRDGYRAENDGGEGDNTRRRRSFIVRHFFLF